MEQMEYLRAKKQLTPYMERIMSEEISGRMMYLYHL